MNRREALAALVTAFASRKVPFGESGITVGDIDKKPTYIVVTIDDDDEDAALGILKERVQVMCKSFGWGDNFPVFVIPPGVDIEVGPINVTIPPNTIVEQFDDCTFIYPVGKPPIGKPSGKQ